VPESRPDGVGPGDFNPLPEPMLSWGLSHAVELLGCGGAVAGMAMDVHLLKSVVGLVAILLAAPPDDARAQTAASGVSTARAEAASSSWPGIVNNVVGRPGRRVAGPRGPAGSEGPAGPPGPAGSSTVQVVAMCASCAAGDKAATGNPALGPIAGALIAGLFGLVGLVIAKENKTSEFRQAWIDALRADIAGFTSAAQSFDYFERARRLAEEKNDNNGELEYEKILADVHQKLVQAQMSIRLRVNPNEIDPAAKPRNDRLLADIEAIRKSLTEADFDAAQPVLKSLHEVAAPILKAEWNRVKRGERSYVLAKYGAIALSVLALAWFAWVGVRGA
jgi:hypothetical protein